MSPTNPFDAYRMDDRVVVVTGAASGIGAADVRGARAPRAPPSCVATSNADGMKATVEAVEAAGAPASPSPPTSRSAPTSRRSSTRAVAEFGRLDGMCNIAGAMFPGLIEDLDDDTIDRGIALNLKGVLYGTQYAIRAMKGAGRGAIVNVSSTGIDAPYAGHRVYAFTKAAVAMLTMTAARRGGRARHPRERRSHPG